MFIARVLHVLDIRFRPAYAERGLRTHCSLALVRDVDPFQLYALRLLNPTWFLAMRVLQEVALLAKIVVAVCLNRIVLDFLLVRHTLRKWSKSF